jgi:phage protein D
VPRADDYAPSVLVEIDGGTLAPQTIHDILSLRVKMDIEQMTSFDLTVSNWDAQEGRIRFKYSDSTQFDIGRQVHVKMGYADRLVSMMTGQITSMAPKFPQQGPSTITVSGLDGMFRLKDRRPNTDQGEVTKYTNMADWQIAEVVAARNQLQINVTREGETHPEVVQKNQDDAQFLVERAKRIDFDCFVLTDPETAETTLHFIRPTDGRDSGRVRNFALRWGENLISFMPTINISEQVGQVAVRGWDPATKQAIVATATAEDLPQSTDGGRSGPQASQQSQQKSDMTVDAPVSSQQEAMELARSLLLERAYRFITATGQIIGLPDLRPGDNLSVSGLGSRFNGNYYVKQVTHSIGDNGFLTEFEARRMHEGTTQGGTP